MDQTPQADTEQAKIWNGTAGAAWVDGRQVLDRMFKPFEDMLVKAVRDAGGSHVLDVGCGTGSTTLAVAGSLPNGGDCTGIDISEPMLATARARAEQANSPAHFIHADAQHHTFAPGAFDTVISRFGVMFFEDSICAFANLRHATTVDGRLCVFAWRSAAENPFMTTAERAAAQYLPNLPQRRVEGPGQFAFADPDYVRAVLKESGWANIEISPVDVECALPEKELTPYLTRFGPVGLILQDAEEPVRAQVIQSVRAAFEPYVHGDKVRYTAACWLIEAVAAAK